MIRLGILFLLVISAGCSTMTVEADYNPDMDFSTLKSYSWLRDVDNPGEDLRINNPLVINSVRSAVDEELQARGLEKTSREKADFLVVWFGAIEQVLKTENINHFYRRYGYGTLYQDPYWNSSPTVASEKEYEQGQLIIDIVDPKTNKLIWRGTAKNRIVPDQTEEGAKKNLKTAVQKILENFPQD